MLLIGAGHWQQLEQVVELNHAPAAPVAAGWMGPATVSAAAAVCVESITRREAASHGTARRCRHAMRPRLEPSGGLWEQHGDTRGRRRGIDNKVLKMLQIKTFCPTLACTNSLQYTVL